MSFRATRQLLIGVALSGIILSVARGEDPQPGSFDADAMAGRLCIRYVHSDLVSDARTESVRDFLEDHKCQIAELAPEFVLAADLNQIDYRLLPTLSVLETGCGRATRNNNLFGWANGRKPFATMRQSIHHVAQRLRLAPHYAGKTLEEKLKKYNRRASYRRKVLALMAQMPADARTASVAESE